MIRQISLSNFQSHVKTTLSFSEGVNAIIGESDQGKTSILRAINWVAKNVPRGNPFFSNYADSDEISASIDVEDARVIRRRNNEDNDYTIRQGGVRETFIAKTGVPEEVSNLLRLHPQINIQNQMDSPFLLMQSAGDAGRLVNQLVRLETIDKTLSKCRSFKREEEKEKNRLTKEVEQDEAEASELRTLVGQVAHVHDLEEDIDRLDDTRMAVDDLDGTISEYEEIQRHSLRYDKIIAHAEAVSEIESLLESYGKISEVVADLAYNIERHENNRAMVEHEKELLESIDLAGLEELIEEWEESLQVFNDLSAALCAAATAKERKEEYERLHAEFEEMMPEVCPFCERPL